MTDTMDTADRQDRRKALDAFAESTSPDKTSLVPSAVFAASADRVFGAQKVAVYRDETKVLERLKLLAAAAGAEWYYRWPVTNANGEKEWVEGPSIKLADDLARIYGNCDLDTRVIDMGDTWFFYARFIDLETGYSRTRPYQQRKGQRAGKKMDADRARDIAFQIGSSKAERNVVVHALRTFADYAFEEAKKSLTDKIGKNLIGWRDRVLDGLTKEGIDKQRVEKVLGRVSNDWLAHDVAKVIATMKAIADGMATWDESYPPLDQQQPAPGDQGAAQAEQPTSPSDLNKFAEGKTEGQANNGNEASPQSHTPAAGPPAPDSSGTSQGPTSTGAAVPPSETTTPSATTGNVKESVPTTEAAYIAHAHAWRDALLDPDAGEKQWKAEKSLRNKCNVSPENRDQLETSLKAKVVQLRKG